MEWRLMSALPSPGDAQVLFNKALTSLADAQVLFDCALDLLAAVDHAGRGAAQLDKELAHALPARTQAKGMREVYEETERGA